MKRKGLELKGIMSFSGYLTSRMEEMMLKDEVFAKHLPFIEKIAMAAVAISTSYTCKLRSVSTGLYLDASVSLM